MLTRTAFLDIFRAQRQTYNLSHFNLCRLLSKMMKALAPLGANFSRSVLFCFKILKTFSFMFIKTFSLF